MKKLTYYAVFTTVCAFSAEARTDLVTCHLQSECETSPCPRAYLDLSFTIDHNQFAPPRDAREPPRNKVTTVTLGATQFQAEPILMSGGRRGFWAQHEGVDHLLMADADGAARYARSDRDDPQTGRCRVE